jgi:hypothetical protein
MDLPHSDACFCAGLSGGDRRSVLRRAQRRLRNPIEQVFAKLKTLSRKTDPRTAAATWRGIGTLLDGFKLRNAPTTSTTPVMLQLNRIVL